MFDTNLRPMVAGGAIGAHLRVDLNSAGKLALAGAGNAGVGVTREPAFAEDQTVSVYMDNSNGTVEVVANGAIAKGAYVYCAASGKVGPTGAVVFGVAMTAATADGDIIEVMPLPSDPSAVRQLRTRVTIAQVNAGATLLPAISGKKYRMCDVALIAIGGNAGAVTTVDILGTQSASGVKLLAAAQANLTSGALLRAGGTGGTILAAGASFVANDANTAITIGKTGSDVTTSTHFDVLLSYVIES